MRAPRTDPEKPWTARADWAAGRVIGIANWSTVRWLWFGTIVWFGFALMPPVALLTNYENATSMPLGLKGTLGIGVPLSALLLLIKAAVVTARARRYGSSCLVLENGIPRPGGDFSARIFCQVDLRTEPWFDLALVCEQTVNHFGSSDSDPDSRRRGSSSSITRTELFREEYECQGERSGMRGNRCTVPVRFNLPHAAHPTQATTTSSTTSSDGTSTMGSSGVTWTLTVSSSTGTHEYRDRFDVPVFPGSLLRRICVIGARNARSFVG